MQLKSFFDLYFQNELSYEDLKQKITEESEDSKEAQEAIEIFDKVEEYFSKHNRTLEIAA